MRCSTPCGSAATAFSVRSYVTLLASWSNLRSERQSTMRRYILGPRYDKNEWFGYGMKAPSPPMMSDLDGCVLTAGMPTADSGLVPSTSSTMNTVCASRAGEQPVLGQEEARAGSEATTATHSGTGGTTCSRTSRCC